MQASPQEQIDNDTCLFRFFSHSLLTRTQSQYRFSVLDNGGEDRKLHTFHGRHDQ